MEVDYDEIAKKDIFGILRSKNFSHRDMLSKFNEIERILIEQSKNGLIKDIDFEFEFPYAEGCSMRIEFSDGALEFYLKTPNYDVKMGYENSGKGLRATAEIFSQIMKEEMLTFAPPVTEEFIYEINRSRPGSILDFTSSLSVVRAVDNNGKQIYKRLYDGDLNNLNIESFREKETFTVPADSPRAIQYLYGAAFDSDTNTSEIHININSDDGRHIRTDIENDVLLNGSKAVNIGKIRIRCIFNAEHKEFLWFDANGSSISREKVAVMLGWAKNSLPALDICTTRLDKGEKVYGLIPDKIGARFLGETKSLLFAKKFEKVADKAFEYAEIMGQNFTLRLSGLEQTGDNEFLSSSFMFYRVAGRDRVFKVTYENNDFNGKISEIKETSRSEFIKFCEAKYDDTCKCIIAEYSEKVDVYHKTHPGINRDKLDDILLQAIMEKEQDSSKGRNPLLLSDEDIGILENNTDILVRDYIEHGMGEGLTVNKLLDYKGNEADSSSDAGGDINRCSQEHNKKDLLNYVLNAGAEVLEGTKYDEDEYENKSRVNETNDESLCGERSSTILKQLEI